MTLEDTVVLLTGAAGGVGAPTARELVRRGAIVAAVDRDQRGLDALAGPAGKGGHIITHNVDVTDRTAVDGLVARLEDEVGPVTALINNAATLSAIGPIWEVEPGRWLQDLTVNIHGTFLCTRAVLKGMRERQRGVIINLTGGGLDGPNPGAAACGCTKVALARFTDTLAEELAPYPGIRVFALAPGFIRSTITRDLAAAPDPQGWFHYVRQWLDEGRENSAEEVGKTFADMLEHAEALPNGRVFYYYDDISALAREASRIETDDLRQVRFRAGSWERPAR